MPLTNRNGKKWQFQFDAANRLTNTITPMQRTNSVVFNDRGLPSILRQPSGKGATNLYDARARLTNSSDAVGGRTYGYDANNNLTSVVEAGKTNSWTFDAYDRVSSYKDADGNLIQYRFDANGNVTNLIYPGNRVVTYAFDTLNRMTNVTDWRNLQTAITYDLASRVTSITRPNGTVRQISYDSAGETTNIIEKTLGNFPVAFFTLNWNSAGRVQWEFKAPLPPTNPPPTRTMYFDADNRMTNLNGQIVSYDPDGNMTNGPATNSSLLSYTFDARNRLLAIGSLAFGYDPAGNRTAVTNGTNITRFIINPNAKLSQVLMRSNGGTTNYYIYGLGLLYEIDETAATTNTLTYHYDYRGSTIALTDGNGLPTDRIEYSAYGMMTYRSGTNDTPFLYNGRYGVITDANGLLYMRARYYDPYLCRFVNADPSGFGGGLNFYAYANGDPISLLDPFGLGANEPDSSGWNLGTRLGGLLQATGGGLQAGLGYTFGTVTSPTIFGGILGAVVGSLGVDQFQAGIRTAWTGQQTPTFLQGTLQAAGMSPTAANWTSAGINVGLTLGAGAYSAYSSAANSVPAIVTSGSTASGSIPIVHGLSEATMTVEQGVARVSVTYVDQQSMLGLVQQIRAQAQAAGASSVVVDTGYVVDQNLAANLASRAQGGGGLFGGTVTSTGTATAPRFQIAVPLKGN